MESFFQSKVHRLKPATLRAYLLSARNVAPFFEGYALEDITPDTIKKFVASRRGSVKDATIKRDLAFASSVISNAIVTLESAPSSNPFRIFSKKHLVEEKRVRWLRLEEYRCLLGACTNDMQRLIIKTAVHTGLRHGELTALRKHHLDFIQREIRLDADMTKSGKERVVPLCVELCHDLERLCHTAPDPLVFHYIDRFGRAKPYTSFNNWWRAARQRSGLNNLRFHDLRHTFASWFIQRGGDALNLKEILGHSSTQMTERYAHLNSSALHRSVRHVFDTEQDNGVLSG